MLRNQYLFIFSLLGDVVNGKFKPTRRLVDQGNFMKPIESCVPFIPHLLFYSQQNLHLEANDIIRECQIKVS